MRISNILKLLYIAAICTSMTFCSGHQPNQYLDLSGEWRFSVDSLNVGIEQNWANTTLAESITLPGTMDDAGKGTPSTLEPKLEKPQVLHLTRKHSYVGPVWYQRDFEVNDEMSGKPLELKLERVLWQSRIWVDGKAVEGYRESVTTPHRYVLPPLDKGKHTLTMRIDNSKQHDTSFDNLAHAYTNDTQVMWNGVLGEVSLRALPDIDIYGISIYPDIHTRELKVIADINNRTDRESDIDLNLTVDGIKVTETHKAAMGNSQIVMTYQMPADATLWDEFNPKTYTLTAEIPSTGATKSADFGMREVSADGSKLLINGTPVFLRGTLECCIFPLTGTPPTDEDGWSKVFGTAKEYGLNHLRFHSWCPPEAAFKVADKTGVYLQVELPQWSLKVGEDSVTTRFIKDEFDRISREYGNHPSLILMTCGNELQPDFDTLNGIVQHMRQTDPRRLYSASTFTFESGHGKHPEPYDQFFVTQYTDRGWVRGQGVFDTEEPSFNKDYATATEDLGMPLISHEIGQYAVYPNLSEIDKYTGTLLPLNFMAVRDDMTRKGLIDQAGDWTMASGKLAALLYKEEIERAMKSPGFSGFQLLDLHDFPGQGTALVGLLDAFWDSKGIITPEEFRQFCAPTVVLSRFEKAVYADGEPFDADILISNYSNRPIDNASVIWSLTAESGDTISAGRINDAKADIGSVTYICSIESKLKAGNAQRLNFNVEIDGTGIKNTWPVWVYPEHKEADLAHIANDNAIVVTKSHAEAAAALKAGKKVLYTPSRERVAGLEGKFVPVFWSPVHFPDQAGAMGIICNPQHEALAEFPTEMHTNWQWWHLLKNGKFVCTDDIDGASPIVSIVDNFANNRRLAAIFEAKCGDGRLIYSSLELDPADASSLSQRQMLYSLLKYMSTDKFKPATEIQLSDLDKLKL